MHRDVTQLRQFYDRTGLGAYAGAALNRVLHSLWPDVRGMVVAGFGYPVPVLRGFRGEAAQTLAMMPAEQGVAGWLHEGRNAAVLVDGDRLPLATSSVDRLVSLHGCEAALRPGELLREIHRVLAPGGRVVVIAPNRTGLWARSDAVPFGTGQPFTAGQIRRLLRDYGFDPCAERAALYAPPSQRRFWLGSAPLLERAGARFGMGGLAGVLVVEAVKLVYMPPRPVLVNPIRGIVGAIEGIAAPGPRPAPGASQKGLAYPARREAGAGRSAGSALDTSNCAIKAPPRRRPLESEWCRKNGLDGSQHGSAARCAMEPAGGKFG